MNMQLATELPMEALARERYEIVNGQVVELEPMGVYESGLATVLSALMYNFANANRLGKVATETLFLLPGGHLQRRPDIAFVSKERWPIGKRFPKAAAWGVVPDLAVEVVSPSNTLDLILEKMREYFQAGVRQVWMVVPTSEQIYVYDAIDKIRVLNRTDTLEGDPALPGFRMPLTALFEEETA